MKYSELSSKKRAGPRWLKFAAAGLLAAALAGCGGGDDGAAGAAGATGPVGATGSAGADAVATVKASALTSEQWSALSLQGQVTKVTINSAPVVEFKITDSAGTPVVGLGDKDAKGAYTNFMFSIAKLVPGSNNSPSRWVSYFPFASGTNAVPMFPEYDHNGTLKDNLDGTYSYTFSLDITKVKGYVDAYTGFDAKHVKADLDDLTYDPTLPHRLIVAAGWQMPGTTTLVKSSANIVYDFVPATGKAVTATDPQRDIVTINKCNECHSTLTMHTNLLPGVHDPKLCVVCHTEQVKYGSGESVPATGNVLVAADPYGAGATLKAMGRALPNFPNMVHHIHMGKDLYYQGYNQFGVKYNEVTYPQPVTNCVKCHDGSATAVNKTTQGDNWKNVPSMLACGSCHDGINFATGGGTTVAGAPTGHIGGAKANDAQCVLCHDATTIPTYHVTVDPTGANGRGGYPLNTAPNTPTAGFPAGQGPSIPLASQLNLPAGVYKIGMEIKQATVSGAAGAKKITVMYRITKDGTPVKFNATGLLMDGVDGSPNIMAVYSTPRDGIAAPADWLALDLGGGTPVKSLRDGTGGTQTGPDADGYYTATLAKIIPDNATMVTAALGVGYDGFVQLNLPAYPKGIRLREPKFAMMTAAGYTARRTVVDGDKCNSCHGQLGVAPSFHSGARNNGQGCALCHDPARTTGHVGATYSFGGGWSVSAKNLVHSIHSSKMRANDYTYEATAANPTGFAEVTYPGILNNCEQCHVAGSYDFSASVSAAALPNLVWTTEAAGDMSNPTLLPSVGLSPWITTLGAGQVNYSTTGTAPVGNLVSSPVSSACFGCHDGKPAVAHMQLNGGTIYGLVSAVSVSKTTDRSQGFAKVETCMVCHGSGKVADIKAVHMN
ncbi:OmcA/MtrC family decaheme c-type cytochrome [Rhodoferax ferrireducens]|uniref:OmcA/MtrC family decaheme c-type cytochrome n=1 Tax=Rhodoferax ferrireducens TaxID=192843 RepID=UPI003BB6AE19